MKIYEDLARLRVEEAVRRGLEAQRYSQKRVGSLVVSTPREPGATEPAILGRAKQTARIKAALRLAITGLPRRWSTLWLPRNARS
jgi:hypothetical protein